MLSPPNSDSPQNQLFAFRVWRPFETSQVIFGLRVSSGNTTQVAQFSITLPIHAR